MLLCIRLTLSPSAIESCLGLRFRERERGIVRERETGGGREGVRERGQEREKERDRERERHTEERIRERMRREDERERGRR